MAAAPGAGVTRVVTPRQFDPDVVQSRLRHMRKLLDDLESFGPVDFEALETDSKLRYAVERILTQLVEVAVGINAHIGATLIGSVQPGYTDSFNLPVEAGALTKEAAERVRPSAGARNVLVHEYLTVDYAKVAIAASRAPEDYGRYIQEIADFLLRREGG
ncbi:MAG: DUF86 domain-containing protein [Nitriliruptorales bacterium]|nr:DUF86 domain-containing protein [Nitriliruptorales bacterium]